MLFDRSRTLSLNLFEHVHGESRDRGGAMVSLIETYRGGGFRTRHHELPDHLPVLCWNSCRRVPSQKCRKPWRTRPISLDALGTRLVRRESRYDAAFAALSQLANGQVDVDALPECWRNRTMIPPTSRRWTPFGKRPKSPSAPTRTRDAHRSATCWH